MITDHNLEKQLSQNFVATGIWPRKNWLALKWAQAKRSQEIGTGSTPFFALVQKFHEAAKHPECKNDSADMIVLVDEAHRTQDGECHQRMMAALPKAAFIGLRAHHCWKRQNQK